MFRAWELIRSWWPTVPARLRNHKINRVQISLTLEKSYANMSSAIFQIQKCSNEDNYLLNYSVRDMVVQISLHNTYISSIALPWLWPSRYPTQLQSLALRMYYNRGCKVAGAWLKYGDLLYQPILGGQQHCRLLNAPVWYSWYSLIIRILMNEISLVYWRWR
mgnify:CR=1 FL=1